MTAASRPTPRARQSNSMCMLSLSKPRESVQNPYRVWIIINPKLSLNVLIKLRGCDKLALLQHEVKNSPGVLLHQDTVE